MPHELSGIGLPYQNSMQFPELADSRESTQVHHEGLQHIGFKLHTEEFLLPMEPVREIIMLPTITYVPHSDSSIEGIFALRGEIMPVLNLRRIMGLVMGQATPITRVIILQCDTGGFGIIVDEITEFVWIQEHEHEALDQNFFGPQYHFLAGVSKAGERMRGVLDVTKLVTHLSRTNPSDEE